MSDGKAVDGPLVSLTTVEPPVLGLRDMMVVVVCFSSRVVELGVFYVMVASLRVLEIEFGG
jgi:hypothetical protein